MRLNTAVNSAPLNQCVECDEVITNPICTECLAERMRLVVGEHDALLAQQIQGIEIEGGTDCLFCGKSMALCAHCFSRETYEFLQENNPSLAAEFASRFDFDVRQELAEFV